MRIVLKVSSGPHAGKTFVFEDRDRFLVGRSEEAHFRLSQEDPFFSRLHFMIEVNPPQCRLTDLESTNGTFVNGSRIEAVDLSDGDVITGGETKIHVQVQADTNDTVDVHGLTMITDGADDSPPSELEVEPVLRSEPSPVASGRSTRQIRTNCVACSPAESAPPVTRDGPYRGMLCDACALVAEARPQPVDGYVSIRDLGSGGMGKVWLAVRMADSELVAVKTIRAGADASPREMRRLLEEARALRKLDHPNIVAFQEMGEQDGLLYFTMDYIAGRDAARLASDNGGRLPIGRAIGYVRDVLQALDYAHAKGCIHRDIKPANILVEAHNGVERAMLVDFGLAHVYGSSRVSAMTMEQSFGGTLAFTAPEQLTDFRNAREPVDVYAAGATLYTMLTGHFVYDLPRQLEKCVLVILQEDPVPLATRRPDLPRELAEVVHRAIARKPEDRWPDPASMRRALKPFTSLD